MHHTPPDSPYLQALAQRVLVYDGAMGTNIQRYNLTAADYGGAALEGCNDHLVLTRPDVIQAIHESFLAVGCDVVETCTFQSTPRRLEEWGLGDKVREINVAAARLARAACDTYATPERPRFVAASIGPTGMLPSSADPVLSRITYDELAANYYEQAKYLLEGGVDVLLIETSQDILEMKAAVAGFERLFAELGRRVPVQAQVTLDTSGRMLLGTDIAAAMTTLEALPIDVLGLNCSTGPEHMREPVRYLTEHATRPISVIPNAGLPLNTGVGEAVYPLEPRPMAAMLGEFVHEYGVRIVGGCCGTTPEHLEAIVAAVGSANGGRGKNEAGSVRLSPLPASAPPVPRVSSAMRAITIHQDPPPLLVGERLNSQGSRKVKRLLLADDYEGLLEVARDQLDSGAHVLDVCVALTERADEAEQMSKVVKLLSMSVETPLMIDSTEAAVIARALEHVPGRAIVNSINMENGRARIDDVVPLVKKHGAAVVALTIDPVGMAKTRERKLEVARRIYDICVGEYGLAPGDLIYDALTFTLATGDPEWIESAKETIEGIRLIKRELPGVFTILGVSNVSFGLTPPARAVLNSVFLHHCVEAGLDAAIVNPAHITPYAEISGEERRLANDLVFNARPEALQHYIEYFEKRAPGAEGDGAGEKADPTAGMAPHERVHWMVLHRKKEGIEEALDAAGVRAEPVRVLNEVLLPAMKEVGDKFGSGELILPFVLQSAEVMKKAVKHLEQFLEKAEGYTKGTVVLATVYGDVHDIGKSLVNTILSNNGYTVHDLGKQVPVNTILEKAVEHKADAIGLSALLVSTSKQMPLCVQELDRRGMEVPVLIGGAAINRRFGRRAMFVEGERPYASGVFYCKDAFEGLETMDVLQDPARRAGFVRDNLDAARNDVFLRTTVGKETLGGDAGGARSDVRADVPVPVPPFFGARVLHEIPLDEVFALLDLDELYRLQWGGRGSGPEYHAAVKHEFEPALRRLTAQALEQGWLKPQAVYGYFPAQSEGNDLVVYDPEAYATDAETRREIARFHFPRQEGRERLCIADYFRSAESGTVDVVALQVVTVGDDATRRFEELQALGEYSEAFYTHGLAVEAAEAVAQWMHRRIRAELGVGEERGKRYSWGYGACPDLEDHDAVFRLLPAAEALGMQLTSAHQLVPEQSTAAIVVHHPEAKYYAVRSSVVPQAEGVA
ncbi:MAG: 5-methyltetrahydrofolate--homocysteine methyltransferase [uncultured Gemmatimonadaceae bacterium]|uniref:Methionine synthase n=1 Tax=uncultured Gemmatimonadaceae bacterium TaxID=246130 RepID=A0A6J4LPR7_9BACT|nr:MAG: 5-methyltetrahydrofolate--homocysteine methyltransferase [uncultured Gemmatimonadaceae bacterium]